MLSDLTQPSFRKRGSRIPAVVMPACRVVMVGVPGGPSQIHHLRYACSFIGGFCCIVLLSCRCESHNLKLGFLLLRSEVFIILFFAKSVEAEVAHHFAIRKGQGTAHGHEVPKQRILILRAIYVRSLRTRSNFSPYTPRQ
jgi:hypothetical protein